MTKHHTQLPKDVVLYNFLKERLSPADLGTAKALIVNYCEQRSAQELAAAKEESAREATNKVIRIWNKHCDSYSPHAAGEDGTWCDDFALKLHQLTNLSVKERE